jgi:hypothetical protein
VARLEDLVYLHLPILDTGREPPDKPPKNNVSFLTASWDLLEALALKEVAQDLPLPRLSLDIVGQRSHSLQREHITTERAQSIGVKAIEMHVALSVHRDQPQLAQAGQMMGNGWAAHIKLCSQVLNAALAASEDANDTQATLVGEHLEEP